MTTPTPGIYPGVPEHEYRAWDALGSTDIKTLATHPAGVFQFRRVYRVEKAEFDLGTVAHSLILEGDESKVAVLNVKDKRGKEWTAHDATAREEGKIPLKLTEWDTVRRMRDSVFTNTDAAALLTNHEPEVSIRWDQNGVPLKGRLDAWHGGAGIIADLKTCRDASPTGFGKDAANYGYHVQAADYADGVNVLTGDVPDYFIVAVCKEAPHSVGVYRLTPEHLDKGRAIVTRALINYNEALVRHEWPTNYDTQDLNLPRWA